MIKAKIGKAKASYIFLIGDEGAVLSYIVGQKVERKIFVSSADANSMTTLNDMLMKDRKAPISILLDSIDQSYQTQSFPPVAKLSVQKLVDARLARDFSPGDITSSLPLGKEKSGRQDWKFLLISVVPSPQLMQWIDFILDLDNPFQGIFLVPVEAENFIKKLQASKGSEEKSAVWHMLVLHNKVSGFRQIITKDGRLTFTRLTQASSSENAPLVVAGNIEQEIVSTVEYLKRLSFQEEEGLDVTVISSPEIVAAIDRNKIGAHQTAKFLTPAQAAEDLSMPAESYADNHFADILFSAFCQTQKKRVLPLNTELGKKLQKMQLGLRAAKYGAIAICILLLFAAAYQAYLWFESFSSTDPIQASIRQSQNQISVIQKETDLLPNDIKKMEDVVSIYETFSEQKHYPMKFIRELVEANQPGILIRDIKWQSNADFESRAKKEPAGILIQMSIEYTQSYPSSEEQLKQINNYLSRLRARFPEYKITHSSIPATLMEGQKIVLDYTRPESRQLAAGNIPMTLRFEIAAEKENNSGRRR